MLEKNTQHCLLLVDVIPLRRQLPLTAIVIIAPAGANVAVQAGGLWCGRIGGIGAVRPVARNSITDYQDKQMLRRLAPVFRMLYLSLTRRRRYMIFGIEFHVRGLSA